MLFLILVGACLTSLATILFLHKFNIRKILYFDKWLDLLFDLVLPLLFVGTMSGMIIAITGGLLTGLYLHVLKHRIGYMKPILGWRGITWVDVPPHHA